VTTGLHTPSGKMRSAVWQGIRSISITEVDVPNPGPRDVVVDIAACGICGSDVHRYAEGAWAAAGMPMGHEFSGTVSAVGAEVEGLAVGDRVAVNPAAPCGVCAQCAAGRTNLCADNSASARGGLSDKVLVRNAAAGERLFVMPSGMHFEEGAFLEPLSVAVRAVRQVGAQVPGPVVVAGLGTIGQCVLRVLVAHGVPAVLGVDISEPRLRAAAEAGADVFDARTGDLVEHVLDKWGTTASPYQPGAGAVGTVFECSGAPSMIDAALRVCRAGGTISLAGLTSETPRVDVNTVVQKELRLLGSFAYTAADAQEAFGLLRDGRVSVLPLISHRVPLSQVASAFEAQHDVAGSIKVVVVPD
jgi:2-desacetyl-2-hydroxyethyl bacteriochlorophyllide A dehydrogenase